MLSLPYRQKAMDVMKVIMMIDDDDDGDDDTYLWFVHVWVCMTIKVHLSIYLSA